MWHNVKTVVRVHTRNGSKQSWAIINGVGNGWLRIKPGTTDGVSNIHMLLGTALANNRKVDVLVQNNEISQATLR